MSDFDAEHSTVVALQLRIEDLERDIARLKRINVIRNDRVEEFAVEIVAPLSSAIDALDGVMATTNSPTVVLRLRSVRKWIADTKVVLESVATRLAGP